MHILTSNFHPLAKYLTRVPIELQLGVAECQRRASEGQLRASEGQLRASEGQH
nr:hypothetical protein [Nostoc sp. DedQUE03]MDZ7977436.1 hypothetical protein [Nostoc sp. DedQUE03]